MTDDLQDRLVRYLDDAWAVEKSLVTSLGDMADNCDDQAVKSLFLEHRDVTHQQEEALEARIRALGEEPSGGAGFFSKLMAKLGDAMHQPRDQFDQVTQDLMKQFGIENFEMAMYQSMMSFANAIGDAETAQLAQQHLAQEKATADRVWQFIAPAAVRPAQAPPVDTTQARAA